MLYLTNDCYRSKRDAISLKDICVKFWNWLACVVFIQIYLGWFSSIKIPKTWILIAEFYMLPFYCACYVSRENYLGSSVSRVTDYRLDNRGSIPDRHRGFSCSLCIQASVYWGPFQGVKHGWGVMLTTRPQLLPRLRISRSFLTSPLCTYRARNGMALLAEKF